MKDDAKKVATDPRRKQYLEAVCAEATGLGANAKVDCAAFLSHYYSQADVEELGYEPRQLAAAALAHLEFARMREPHVANVRAFNPTRDRDGYTSVHTVVETVNDDMPFLVDSLGMALRAMGHAVHGTIHPLFQVDRSNDGELSAIRPPEGKPGTPESFIHFEIVRETDVDILRAIENRLKSTLQDVRAAVDDWAAMLQHLRDAAAALRATAALPADARSESVALLDWLAENHFTLLGYREYELTAGEPVDELRSRPGTGLGLLRSEPTGSQAVLQLGGRARDEARSNSPLVITKASERSTVHRPALLDHIGVKIFDDGGHVVGERRFLGLFTSTAYSGSPSAIPLVRLKIQRLLDESGLDPRGHRSKSLQHILNTLPRDDLFQTSLAELRELGYGVLSLQEHPRVKLFCRPETFGRFYSCLVYLPRDQYGAKTRRAVEQVLLEGLDGHTVESELAIGESPLARIAVTVHATEAPAPEPNTPALQAAIESAVRTWHDRLRESLLTRLPEERALALLRTIGEQFSAAYQEDVDPARASHDVLQLTRIHEGVSELELDLAQTNAARATLLRLTTFQRGEPIKLYLALPILENLGFKVIRERSYTLRLTTAPIWVQDFEVEPADGRAIDVSAVEQRFKQCFALVLGGHAENDTFNSFVVSAGFDWREAVLLRAFCKYLLQTRIRYSQAYMQDVLSRYPRYCRALVDKFASLFDVDRTPEERTALGAASDATLRSELDRTASLDDDRILKAYAAVVNATLRTNYYQRTGAGEAKPYISFKLDPTSIPELPKPRPKFEIFVYSQRMEGVHLRSSPIARGGIRWSDRREDFRTEVLGLMKAQQVKNTVIVPNGAKGGFVCKALPSGDREAQQREVVACYETFIRGLLDLTDNIVDGKTRSPNRVLRRDGDDPYLVVAADKGTATFSDRANSLAAEYEFWLDDAFASGGSTGYDHKKIAITARGAWEATKRHFREIGIDHRHQSFTAVGIGDMSGDVFGNGMLLSPHTKLVAAFNHQHIFIDPDPDPSSSFKERQRLFDLPRSTWDDYDRKTLSSGGGIYPRQQKSIALSPAAQTLLDVTTATVTPLELIRAILRARVDLLWNGGIGTYVKASGESHADAGDPANDAVRIDGNELRCRVVAEGGNLGVTQRGRIEYAQHGGRINTDFIDNSGGVDSSDREVNIKILLADAIRRRELTLEDRNTLLAEMTDDIVRLVLGNNYAQTQALSMMAARAAERLPEHARLIRLLEARGVLDRNLEFLPSDEQIEERGAMGLGLTRPELAIVLSYSKIELVDSLAQTDIPEDEFLASELTAYFPPQLTKRFKPLLSAHRLRREIIAMLVGGSMINRMGPFFVLRAAEETGASIAQVARAYAIVREVFGVRKLWRDIEALDYRVAPTTQYDSIFRISRMVRQAVYWLLQNYAEQLDIESVVRRFQPGVRAALESLPKFVRGRALQRLEQNTREFEASGLTAAVAQKTASLALMPQLFDIIELAREFQLTPAELGELYFAHAAELRLDLVREQIEGLQVEGRWRSTARVALLENLGKEQRALLRGALSARGGDSPAQGLTSWLQRRAQDIGRLQRTLDDMQMSGPMDFATLSVALKEIARLG